MTTKEYKEFIKVADKIQAEMHRGRTRAILTDTEAMLARLPPGDILVRMSMESMANKLRAELEEEGNF
jgi:hypothetical protein